VLGKRGRWRLESKERCEEEAVVVERKMGGRMNGGGEGRRDGTGGENGRYGASGE